MLVVVTPHTSHCITTASTENKGSQATWTCTWRTSSRAPTC
uniref:Uncharacterized protein n=1 Tax=Arundo donax TaxID=35708 RepID=A0A0A9G051_ARUDO